MVLRLVFSQVFLAGLALFWNPGQWSSHVGFSRVLIIFPILIFILSFIAQCRCRFVCIAQV